MKGIFPVSSTTNFTIFHIYIERERESNIVLSYCLDQLDKIKTFPELSTTRPRDWDRAALIDTSATFVNRPHLSLPRQTYRTQWILYYTGKGTAHSGYYTGKCIAHNGLYTDTGTAHIVCLIVWLHPLGSVECQWCVFVVELLRTVSSREPKWSATCTRTRHTSREMTTSTDVRSSVNIIMAILVTSGWKLIYVEWLDHRSITCPDPCRLDG